MRAADANIEVCGGTFVQMQSNKDGAEEEAALRQFKAPKWHLLRSETTKSNQEDFDSSLSML